MANELKIRDLCGRLPYGVRIMARLAADAPEGREHMKALTASDIAELERGNIADITAYLRPMGSMTEEEREEYRWLCMGDMDGDRADTLMDWLHTYHFDFRGLIDWGLALEAPGGMYAPINGRWI